MFNTMRQWGWERVGVFLKTAILPQPNLGNLKMSFRDPLPMDHALENEVSKSQGRRKYPGIQHSSVGPTTVRNARASDLVDESLFLKPVPEPEGAPRAARHPGSREG